MDPGPDTPISDDELPALFQAMDDAPAAVIAVSGGADSMALMHCLARWRTLSPSQGRTVVVATVDHGLRAASAAEAAFVAEAATSLGLVHRTLRWTGPKSATGRQAAARSARYGLLTDLADSLAPTGGGAVVTAHHRDDRVETFLMRLAHGSGLDGLTGMRDDDVGPSWRAGVRVLRPFLDVPKRRLLATLRAAGQRWIDDPSNEDTAFERVRLRRLTPALAAAGLDADAITRSIGRLARARDALDAVTDAAWRRLVTVDDGTYAELQRDGLAAEPADIAVRLLQRCLAAFGGGARPSTLAEAEAVYDRIRGADRAAGRPFKSATMAGCLVAATRGGTHLVVTREWGRDGPPRIDVAPTGAAVSFVWDHRFRVTVSAGADAEPLVVRALGTDGLARVAGPDRAPHRHPRAALLTAPSLWRRGTLLAAPTLADRDPGLDPPAGPPAGPCKLFTIRPLIDGHGRRRA